jgi:hypothetical protein
LPPCRHLRRLHQASRQDLVLIARTRVSPNDYPKWAARLVDRAGLIMLRANASPEHQSSDIKASMQEMRIALNLLRSKNKVELDDVRASIAEYFSSSPQNNERVKDELLQQIDHSLTVETRDKSDPEIHTIALLVSLRRNLFPDAQPWSKASVAA